MITQLGAVASRFGPRSTEVAPSWSDDCRLLRQYLTLEGQQPLADNQSVRLSAALHQASKVIDCLRAEAQL
jgi:hypothetical protein